MGLNNQKFPQFMKTIRFRLTIGYMLLFVLLILEMIIGINFAVWQNGIDLRELVPRNQAEFEIWVQSHQADSLNLMHAMRVYSALGVLAVVIIGAVGVYFLSGLMLKPIDRISSLASRISYTEVKERLNYQGPNDELKRLADTFDNMLSRLEQSIGSQKQLIQDASHELRTPIAIAMTNIEVLEMNETASVGDYQKTLKILKLSLDRMNNISNSLLLLSEEIPAVTHWSKIEMNALINEVCDELKAEAEKTLVGLDWTLPSEKIFIRGDIFHIKQTVVNLVNNGIKYNLPGGSVHLSLHYRGAFAIIEIKDTGIGIGPSDLPRIFDRFYRVDKSRSRAQGGSGLGLAIVKKFVEEHGGTVSVESTPGTGSIFRISLPLFEINN